ncbi:uncharacterized protein A1O5_03635 [Cladophialophora psammophila CBS 110553]|uniref:PRISE-like Rossmann-fold domain-containing protein n=1 Tax=Cladophialophora psammophila CBS 110553 TaxID=1182543 RepID=W9X136_9EURO|nr:uncharacterized protein A1O5_03635 [Cladophialophora psammophila CBS 110553]EXJ73873.1 hypothetical protein A1O5_03635 [Cladophialophora psammophila CBS 110553]
MVQPNPPYVATGALAVDNHRVELYSGFDSSLPIDEIVTKLKAIDNVGDVGPVYSTAYTAHGKSQEEVIKANAALVPNYSYPVIGESVSQIFLLPYRRAERNLLRPSPWGDKIFYYTQVDENKRLARDKKWGWCELRPDAVICIGFMPQNNAVSIVQGLGLYTFQLLQVAARFPGNEGAWNSKRTDTSSTVLARFHIYAAMHPEKPIICEYFGVETLDGPHPAGKAQSIGAFMEGNTDKWAQWVRETRVRPGTLEGTSWLFVNYLTQEWTFDHPFDLSETYATGFADVLDTPTQWLLGFDRMKAANLIPK